MTLLLSVTIPITLFLVLNNEKIVTVLYGYGAFDEQAIHEASRILIGMSVAFFAQVIGYVLIKVLNAQLQNRRVVLYSLAALSSNIAFNILFFRSLGPLCLGLGESLYALIIFILCMRYFKLYQPLKTILLLFIPMAILYSMCSIYLEAFLGPSSFEKLLGQLGWFGMYWGIMLLSFRKTRTLILGGGWIK
jgi:putative peptidoglycan lipid II flippase